MNWCMSMVLVGLLGVTGLAHAQFAAVVSDPGALAQRQAIWLQEALQWVKELENQVTAIEQQKQIIQDQLTLVTQGAKNLLATPIDLANDLKTLTDQYNSALQTVQGVSYTVSGWKAQWDALYGTVTSNQSLPAKARAIAQAISMASQTAGQAQALYERLCAQATQIQTLLAASKAAPGALAALQDQTQLVAVLGDQLNTIAQINMTTGRAQVMQIADDARTSAQAVENSANWISGFMDQSLIPTPLGQKGPGLPQ